MKHLMLAATAAFAITVTPWTAAAQTEAAAPPPATAPLAKTDSAKLTLVERFYRVMEIRKNTEDLMRAMMPITIEQEMQRHPGLTPAARAALVEAMEESIDPIIERILERFAPVYADAFTIEELNEIIAFYEGPTGQAFLAKQPQLSAATTEITRDIIPEMQREMLRRFCSKIDCVTPLEPEPETNAS